MSNRDICSHHEALYARIERMTEVQEKVNGTLGRIDHALGEGKIDFAKIGLRLTMIERVVYGLVGAALLGIVSAALALLLK